MIIKRKKHPRIHIKQKEYGMKSKILGLLAPGAYQAKEAAKYAYDGDDYKKKRWKYALRGAFTPGTATYIKKKVQKMAERGASQEEIRRFLSKGRHLFTGIGEFFANYVTKGIVGKVTGATATVTGIADKVTGNRANT